MLSLAAVYMMGEKFMSEVFVAVKSLILNQRRALIVQRSNYCNVGENSWELVGGGVKFEEDLLEGLQREIKEEVSLKIGTRQLLYASSKRLSPHKKVILLVYLSESENRNVVLSEEHKAYQWVDKKELMELIDADYRNAFLEYSILDQLEMD